MNRLAIAVTFDGVLHSYTSGWQGADVVWDPPVPGAMRWLAEMSNYFTVAIYSSRSHLPGGVGAMRDALKTWLTAEVGAQEAEAVLEHIEFLQHKPVVLLSVDPRSICFTGTFPSKEEIEAFRPWTVRSGRAPLAGGPALLDLLRRARAEISNPDLTHGCRAGRELIEDIDRVLAETA